MPKVKKSNKDGDDVTAVGTASMELIKETVKFSFTSLGGTLCPIDIHYLRPVQNPDFMAASADEDGLVEMTRELTDVEHAAMSLKKLQQDFAVETHH